MKNKTVAHVAAVACYVFFAACGADEERQRPPAVQHDPCMGVTCSNHGNCTVSNNTATCNCQSGYEAAGLSCLEPDPVDRRDLLLRLSFNDSGNLMINSAPDGSDPDPTGQITSTPGAEGRAARFSGAEAIQMGNYAQINGDMTFAAFIRHDSSFQNNQTLIQILFHNHEESSASDQNSGFRFELVELQGHKGLFFQQHRGSDGTPQEGFVQADSLFDNDWHFVAFVKRGNSIEIHADDTFSSFPVDGSIQYSNSAYHPGSYIGVMNPFCESCGDWHSAGSEEFLHWLAGAMDEVRLYSRALGSNEIDALRGMMP